MNKYINIHDYENGRTIFAPIPAWLADECAQVNAPLADVIIQALGLSDSTTEWMFTDSLPVLTELQDIVQHFAMNAREAIKETTE